MATILVTWELGAGLGHLMPLAPIVRRLRRRGHEVFAAVRDLSRIHRVFNASGVRYLQAPVKVSETSDRVKTPRNFAHILYNCGYSGFDELIASVHAWQNLLEFVKPDVILFDHSPTALLAARKCNAKRVVFGTGFCCPPDIQPLPDFRPWMPDASQQLAEDEAKVLATVNRVLEACHASPLGQLSQLYREVNATFLTTFPELDHYRKRSDPEYVGVWPSAGGALPAWPDGEGKRVFAYLHRFPGLPRLLGALKHSGCPTLVFADGIDVQLREQHECSTLRFVEQRLDVAAVADTCDMAVLPGGHGTTAAMLLAGKPLLIICSHLEQVHNGLAVKRLGAGCMANANQEEEIVKSLAAVQESDRYATGARRFADRYAGYDPAHCIAEVVRRLESLGCTERDSTALANSIHVPMSPAANGASAKPQPEVVASSQVGTFSTSLTNITPTLILGIGTGRCGTKSIARTLSRNPATHVLHESPPPLPWDRNLAETSLLERFNHIAELCGPHERIGDVASYYLPYVEEIIGVWPDVRVICIKRDRECTVESFVRWIARTRHGVNVDHWRAERKGLHSDPWDVCFPKYAVDDIREGIRRYWDDYYASVESLVRKWPNVVRVFDFDSVFRQAEGLPDLLNWVGIPKPDQALAVEHANRSQ